MTTILTCSKCSGEGSLYKSKYGGNDPDVWRTGQCDACKGSGNESCALRGCDEKAVTFNDDGEPLCSDCLASTLHLAASSSPGLAVREALSNVRTAILEAPIEVVTDTLWMPERLSKNETVVDYIDSAFSAAGSQRRWVTVIVPSGYKDAAEFVADCGLETVPVSSDHMPKVREVWSASTHDEIIKRLMEQVGMPNSHSLYVAFKQFANELHALAIDALVPGDGVGVKPLAWRQHPDGETQRYEGVTAIGNNYAVFKAWWGAQNKWGWIGNDEFHHSDVDARSACNIDYEQRIRSALASQNEGGESSSGGGQ
jgi:hypothetical protein